jgi:CRISPR type IV-associated protein Csf3
MAHSSRFHTTRYDTTQLCQSIFEGTARNKREKPVYKHMSHDGNLDFNRGHQRNALNFYAATDTASLTGYCIGDKEAIIDLLTSGYITHIGKRRREGMGFITGIELDDDDDASVRWKIRVRPFKEDGDVVVASPLRPPYWDKKQITQCFLPANII